MLIWLVDFDGKMENLALMQLSTWHKAQGGTVRLKFGDARPELFEQPDKVYISCLFRWNRDKALALADAWGNKAVIGGTGIDLALELPEEVQICPPDYSLYGKDRAVGFISRGCTRKCSWCVVPRKEGKLRRVSTAEEIVGNRQKVLFLDNNFLALPDFAGDLHWLAKNKIAIDFNQGLDARLITDENAELLARCKWLAGPRISLDSDNLIPAVDLAFEKLTLAGIAASRICVFVLIGFHGFKSDVKRLLHLRKRWSPSVFPMGFKDLETGCESAKGWDRQLYNKYRRLIIRFPRAYSVWDDFHREVASLAIVERLAI